MNSHCLPLLLLISACSGYGDLPLPLRESTAMVTTWVDLYPDATGRIEVAPELPPDAAEGLITIVGSPQSDHAFAQVINWAAGPCRDETRTQDVPLGTICVAVYTDQALGATAFNLTWVVELRASGRRFTVDGEVTRP